MSAPHGSGAAASLLTYLVVTAMAAQATQAPRPKNSESWQARLERLYHASPLCGQPQAQIDQNIFNRILPLLELAAQQEMKEERKKARAEERPPFAPPPSTPTPPCHSPAAQGLLDRRFRLRNEI